MAIFMERRLPNMYKVPWLPTKNTKAENETITIKQIRLLKLKN